MSETQNNPVPASEPPSPTAGGEAPATQQPVKTFTQAEVEKLIGERLEREKSKATKAADEARKQAEADAAAKNGEWQKLAEQRAGELAERDKRIAELEPATAQAAAYEAAIKKQLEADRTKLPTHIVALLDKLPVLEQIEWIAANRETVGASNAPSQPPKHIPGTPEAAGNKSVTEAELQKRRAAEARRARTSF